MPNNVSNKALHIYENMKKKNTTLLKYGPLQKPINQNPTTPNTTTTKYESTKTNYQTIRIKCILYMKRKNEHI